MWTRNGRQRGQTGRAHLAGRGPMSNNNWRAPLERPSSPPFGLLLQTLNEVDIDADPDEKAEIADCAYVASFNWLDCQKPRILIPGTPPAWTPLEEPRPLKQDHGDYFRDPNAARSPSHPLEPAVLALLTENENLNPQEIDLFACSSTVGSLLRFVRRVDRPFRFFVEVIGNTVFFIRHENSPTELLLGVKGYGHTFPEAYTTWDAEVKGSASHQRLLRYNFAKLNCILRFECDGYLKSKVSGRGTIPAIVTNEQKDEATDDFAPNLDSITASLSSKETESGPLEIGKAGWRIPQAAVFDLKTRSCRRKDLTVLEDELPRFWVAQIPNFILALHDGGVFNDANIKVQDVRDDVQNWKRENQEDIRRLGWLLRKIIAVAKAREDGKLEVRCKSLEALELREQETDDHDVLSPALTSRWLEEGPSNETCISENKSSESDDESTDGVTLSASETSKYHSHDSSFDSDEESVKDYTACSAEDCGYCGHCSY